MRRDVSDDDGAALSLVSACPPRSARSARRRAHDYRSRARRRRPARARLARRRAEGRSCSRSVGRRQPGQRALSATHRKRGRQERAALRMMRSHGIDVANDGSQHQPFRPRPTKIAAHRCPRGFAVCRGGAGPSSLLCCPVALASRLAAGGTRIKTRMSETVLFPWGTPGLSGVFGARLLKRWATGGSNYISGDADQALLQPGETARPP